jgi:hypothetical protein
MQGYKIAVTNSGCFPDETKLQLEQWGYIVDLLDISSITVDVLLNYHIVWITNGASLDIEIELKDDDIRDYVFQGGGLIFCQPDYIFGIYIPKCLPYTWEITNFLNANPCAATIVDPTHTLTNGLTVDDMPDCYETMGYIAPEYTILSLSDDGEPGLACAEYGLGKIIVQMDAPLSILDLCGDYPALSKDMVSRMIGWAGKTKSVNLPILETVNRPLLQFLQSSQNMFPLLQKLLLRLGL